MKKQLSHEVYDMIWYDMIWCNDKLCHGRNDNTNNVNGIHPSQGKPNGMK